MYPRCRSQNQILLQTLSARWTLRSSTCCNCNRTDRKYSARKNEKAQNFLKKLKQAGLQLALDDFGTGYSNFHYLSELHPDIVKIDRGFTSKAITDKKEYYLLNQFSNMIHNLGLKLCIEGIETEDELQKMKLLKPDYCQGFYWGQPCLYDEFRKYFVDVKR